MHPALNYTYVHNTTYNYRCNFAGYTAGMGMSPNGSCLLHITQTSTLIY